MAFPVPVPVSVPTPSGRSLHRARPRRYEKKGNCGAGRRSRVCTLHLGSIGAGDGSQAGTAGGLRSGGVRRAADTLPLRRVSSQGRGRRGTLGRAGARPEVLSFASFLLRKTPSRPFCLLAVCLDSSSA